MKSILLVLIAINSVFSRRHHKQHEAGLLGVKPQTHERNVDLFPNYERVKGPQRSAKDSLGSSKTTTTPKATSFFTSTSGGIKSPLGGDRGFEEKFDYSVNSIIDDQAPEGLEALAVKVSLQRRHFWYQ